MSDQAQTLRDLINEARRRRRDTDGSTPSFRALAAECNRAGAPINHTTLAAIGAGTYRPRPSPSTLRAVAWLAGVSYETARKVAGLPPTGALPVAEQLPENVDELWPENVELVVRVARQLLKMQDARQVELSDEGLPPTALHVDEAAEDAVFADLNDAEQNHRRKPDHYR